MLFVAIFYYAIFFFLLQDLEFMTTFSKYLGEAVLFILPTSELTEEIAMFLNGAFSVGFHYWASFLIAVYLMTKTYPNGVNLS